MKRKLLIPGGAFSLLALIACGVSYGLTVSAAAQAVATNALQLEGTWLITVTPSFLPARRAALVDPITAPRAE